MMSRVYYLILDCPSEEDVEKDATLVQKLMWMRTLKQDQLHIKECFTKSIGNIPSKKSTKHVRV